MRFFLKKSTQFWLPRFGVLLSTHDFVPIFFLFFSPLFSGGTWVLLWSWCPELRETRGGARVAFFFPCKRGGEIVTCDIFAPNRGGKRFFCPFFGGVFGSSVPLLILDGWASEKEAAEATRAEELGGEEEAEVTRRSRRRKKKKKKKKEEKGEEEEGEKKKQEGRKEREARKERKQRKKKGRNGRK